MVILRNFTLEDISLLKDCIYKNLSEEEIKELISDWNTKIYQGKYFEMFAVMINEQLIGTVSLYEHSKDVVGSGPEIFEAYRGCGYGTKAVEMSLEIAKKKGYKIAIAQIRTNNQASIALHKKLGFEMNHEYVNKKGNEVGFWMKALG